MSKSGLPKIILRDLEIQVIFSRVIHSREFCPKCQITAVEPQLHAVLDDQIEQAISCATQFST